MEQKKYVVLVLVKHSDVHFRQSPEEEATSQKEINAFIESWRPRIVQIAGYHCCGLSEYDWFGLFAMDDVSHWVAFRETYHRQFHGRGIKRTEIVGISHGEFVNVTNPVAHFHRLRELGMLPGMAEVKP